MPADPVDDQSPFEPALAAIRTLGPGCLDALLRRWLAGRGFHAARRTGCASGAVTYLADPAADPDAGPTLVRLHLRRSALQVHHVDAFVGALCRARIGTGLLVSTGPVLREALQAAQRLQCPRVRIVAGADWAEELAQAGLLRRGSRRVWTLGPAPTANPPPPHASSRETDAGDSRRW